MEEWYYLCSENKDADQLLSYSEADLRLCRLLVFSRELILVKVAKSNGRKFFFKNIKFRKMI